MNRTTKTTKTDGEYRVRLFIDGEYQAGADYFTDCKEDAAATAKHMQEHGGYSDKSTDFAKAEQEDYNEEHGTQPEDEEEDMGQLEKVAGDCRRDCRLAIDQMQEDQTYSEALKLELELYGLQLVAAWVREEYGCSLKELDENERSRQAQKRKQERITRVLDGLEQEVMYRFNAGLVLHAADSSLLDSLEDYLKRCRAGRKADAQG